MATKKEGTTKKPFKWSPEEARKLAADRNFVHYTISYILGADGKISARSRKMGAKLKISDTAKKFISIDDKRQKEEAKFVEKHSKNVTLADLTDVPNYANDSRAIILNALPVYDIDRETGTLYARGTGVEGEVEMEYARIMGPALAVAFIIYNYYAEALNLDAANISTTLYQLVDEVIRYGYSEEDLREESPKNKEFKDLINDEKAEKTRTERDDVRTYNKYYAIFGPATRKIESEESSKSGKNVSLASRLIDKYNKLSADGKLSTSYIRVDRRNDKETVTVIDQLKGTVPSNLNKYQELRLVINPTEVDLQNNTLRIIEEEAARNPKSVLGRMWDDYVRKGSNVIRGQVRSLAVAGGNQPRGRPATARAPTAVAKTGVRPTTAAAKAPGRAAPKVGAAPRPAGAKGALGGTRRATITPVTASRVTPTSEAEPEADVVEQEPEAEFEEPQGDFPVSEGAGVEDQEPLVSE